MSPREKPNLLFVFADQLGYSRCGYAGDARARTPTIDAFSRQGVNFSNAVASMPVCAAFRASLLTGKYTTSTGMVINELRMNPGHECFGHVLTRSGYDTAYVGKWHLYADELGNHLDARNSYTPPGPHRLGFDGYWASYGFHHDYYGAYYHTDSPAKLSYGPDVYEPDAQTDMLVRFLRQGWDRERPFAAFLSYGTPHDPWVDSNVPEAYRRLFGGTDFPHPPNYRDANDPYADSWGRLASEQRAELPAWRRNYYAMVANLDWNIGRLLATLTELGLAENTIVVFTSDHGEMFGAQGRRAKNTFYDEAARIPFLVRWPAQIAAGHQCDACVSNVDMMPTLLGLMGLEVPAGAEGTDCSRLALGRAGPGPEAALLQNTGACAAWQDGHEWRALRTRQYTYARYRVDGAELLFDNLADPYQLRNLAGDPGSRSVLAELRGELGVRMAGLNDSFEACTWYRDHWTEGRCIVKSATSDWRGGGLAGRALVCSSVPQDCDGGCGRNRTRSRYSPLAPK